MRRKFWILAAVLLNVIAVTAACNFNAPDSTPTSEAIIEEPIDPLPDQSTPGTLTPSVTPSLTPTAPEVVVIASPSSSPTSGPPTASPTPEPTLGPWEHVVQSGESLIGIIGSPPYNYRDNFASVIDVVLRLNNLPDANSIFAGQTLLIPRPTPTSIPQGVELTQSVIATLGGDPAARLGNVALPPNTTFGCHNVREGETIVGIIEQYGGATLEVLAQLNPDLNFLGCDFDSPGGGPNCNPFLIVDQCVQVPFPTPTPTKSPTPSGLETPTPTPTYRPPSLISPSDGSIAGAGRVELFWASVGVLQPDEVYLVEVVDVNSGTTWAGTTRSTSMMLPANLIPTDGETHIMNWTVSVAISNAQGVFVPVGPRSPVRTFQWQSR